MKTTPVDLLQVGEQLGALLAGLKLPVAARELYRRLCEAGQAEALPWVLEVFEQEVQERQARRVERLRTASKLPPGKTFGTLQEPRLALPLVQKLRELARGDVLSRAQNVLCFGLPGRGKSHAACALGHALVERGHAVFFTPTFRLVQELLQAKRALELPKALRKLESFELLILDDLGYVQQSSEEMEVLFTLLAERYERQSILLTTNLMFSEWDRIFKNPMTTAAAIDRLVHHSVILEFARKSFRAEEAEEAKKKEEAEERGEGEKAPPTLEDQEK